VASRRSLVERLSQGDPTIFTELFELLDEAVTIREPGGEIAYANRAALRSMGFESLEDLTSRPSRSIWDEYTVTDEQGDPLTWEDVPSIRMMRGQPGPPVLMRVVHRDTGELRWRLLKATALRDADEEFLGAITVIEDVTAVKTAEIQTRILAESGRILASSLDYNQTLRNIAAVVVPALADFCAVDLVDERGRLVRVGAAHQDPRRRELAARLGALEPTHPEPTNPAGRVVLTGTSELYPEIGPQEMSAAARSDEHLALIGELRARSMLMVPMQVPSRTIGLLTLVTDESHRRLDHGDVELAEQLGRRAAVAVENSRLHTTLTRIAQTLQQSLRPDELPELDDWDLASLYRPVGSQPVDVGGDFYDVFQCGGAWFAIVGDVTGKGVGAAALTSLMRYGARVAGRLDPEPSAILSRLDEALKEQPTQSLCTALCLSIRRRQVVLSSAGHPPAMLVSPDGTIRQAPDPGPLLGAFADAEWSQARCDLQPGESLLVYTDGVVETLGREERFGEDRLGALLSSNARLPPQEILTRLEAQLDAFRSGPERDDVAALLLRAR
jgi:PAS domain S-box-containing protein